MSFPLTPRLQRLNERGRLLFPSISVPISGKGREVYGNRGTRMSEEFQVSPFENGNKGNLCIEVEKA